jgi:hypothetical protein
MVHVGAVTANQYTEYSLGVNGGEPSIGFDPHANAALYGASLHVQRVTWNDATTPATMATTTVSPTAPTTLDAITVVDQNTHRTFSSQLAGACSIMSYSDDAGATWNPSQGCGANTLLDHQSIGSGPFHAPLTSTILGNDAVYYCAQNGFSATCSTSYNGGATFEVGHPISNAPGNYTDPAHPDWVAAGGACAGLHGHLRVAPNGTAYVPIKSCGGAPTASSPTNYEFYGGHPSLSVSTDNGVSWTIHMAMTGSDYSASDPSVGIGKNNTVYFGWHDGHNPDEFHNGPKSAAKIAISKDNGQTFTNTTDVTPAGVNNVMFPEVIAGDDNRAAFAFLGTAGIGDTQTNAFVGDWYMYVATTYDGGLTWTTVNATPGKPIQRGCIDMQGVPTPPQRTDVCSQRNLLDFNDITVDGQGRVLVAYARGCTGTCLTNNSLTKSTGNADYVLRQSYGPGLYAAFDGVLPGSGPSAVVAEVPFTLLLPLGVMAGCIGWLARRLRGGATH